MAKYILKRLGLMVITFVLIFLMVFVLIKLLDPPPLTGQDHEIDRMRKERMALGYTYLPVYDEEGKVIDGAYIEIRPPIMEELRAYLKMVFTEGNFGVGETMYGGQDVSEVFLKKLPFSIYINVFSSLIAIPVGISLGIWAALRKNKLADHVISTAVMLGVSVPVVVFAPLLQYFLCFRWKIFPITLLDGTGWAMFAPSFFWSAMPAILTLAFLSVASLARYSRAELSEVLTSEFMLLARTKGLTKAQATVRHALKNAMVVVFPMILGEIIGMLMGSLITEQVFSVPGIGSLYINSMQKLDYNFFLLVSTYYLLIGLVAGLVIDLSYQFIDPRIRMGAKK